MNDIELELPPARPLADGRVSDHEQNPRQRILVVDDDAAMRRLNAEVLILYGYAVDTAVDGSEAWDALQINHYDLLITDNGMPKVTGIELLEKLHDSSQELPTIMATGTAPVEEFARAPWLQPAVLLLKPYTFDELLRAVKNVLQQSSSAHGENAPPPNWQSQPATGSLRI
jgi:DNA-binding NtrC family response regulator